VADESKYIDSPQRDPEEPSRPAGEAARPPAYLVDGADLDELARMPAARLRERLASLPVRLQAELALRLPAARRLELILHAPKPMRLVRALPDADFYLTVREIGPADALPLLRLGSAPQLQHLLDLESWRHDRFDTTRSGAWVALLAEAGEPALRRFVRAADDELLALLFQRWLRVEQLEFEETGEAEKHGHGMSEAGTTEAYMTPDGNYRFTPAIAEHAPAIRAMLQSFFVDQPERYQRLLWAARWELPAELEEQALHWRQSRLEEHGFPTLEESRDVYAPPSGNRRCADPPAPADRDGLPASRIALTTPTGAVRLAPLIDALGAPERERVLHEMAALANRLIVADRLDGGDPDVHRAALAKAATFVNVALAQRQCLDPSDAGPLLRRLPLIELFREGYAGVNELRARAHALTREGWASHHPAALKLLDTPVAERIEALLEARPGFVEVGEDGQPGQPRGFLGLEEIRETAASVELAEVVGSVLTERLGLEIEEAERAGRDQTGEVPTFSTVFLTLLAWHATRRKLRADPLPGERVLDFMRAVASRRTAPPDAGERAVEGLLRALTQRVELGARELAVLQAFARFSLERLAEQCSGLDPGVPVDPRFVTCMLIAGDPLDGPATETEL
jgi:hypothetical protein